MGGDIKYSTHNKYNLKENQPDCWCIVLIYIFLRSR